MKLPKVVIAIALTAMSFDFVEAAPLNETAAISTVVSLQLPPPPPRPPLPRFGRRRHYVKHRTVRRQHRVLGIHLPPPPPRPPLPRL